MKRLLSLLLVIAMLFSVCTMFTACDGNTVSSEDKEKKEETKKAKRVTLDMQGVTVEEGVVYDDNGIVLTVTDLTLEDDCVIFTFEAVNNTDEYLTLQADTCVVNECSTAGYGFVHYVDANSTTTIEIYLDVILLELLQVKKIGQLDFLLNIIDHNYDYLAEDEPVSVATSENGFVHTPSMDGEVLFDKEGIRITLIETFFSKDEGSGMFMFVENETDDFVSVGANNLVLNGWLQSQCYFSVNLFPNTNTVSLLDLSGLEDIGIKKVKDIQNVYFDVFAHNSEEYITPFNGEQVAYIPGDADFVTQIDIEGETLFENDQLQVIMTEAAVENAQPVFRLYFNNKTDNMLYCNINEMWIDGMDCYNTLYNNLPAGTQSLQTLYLWTEFKLDSLNELESVEGMLKVYSDDSSVQIEKLINFPLD